MAHQRNPAAFLRREHVAPSWVDTSILTRSGIFERVQDLISAAGWPMFLEMRGEADQEDTAEFLGTFVFHSSDDEDEFHYVHRGVEYSCTIEELRHIFGWAAEGEVFIPYSTRGSMVTEWRTLIRGDEPYVPSASSAKLIADPEFFFLHFALGRTLLARGNGQHLVSKVELGILHLIRQGRVVHWAHHWCTHLKNLRTAGQVHVGGMVTMFLRRRHPAPVPEGHRILQGKLLEEARFKVAELIRVSRTGRIDWIYHQDPARRPPRSPTRRTVRGSSRRQADPRHQMHPPEQSDRYEHGESSGGQYTREQLFVAFNATRAMIRGMPPVEPPPGWMPGDAIPPEYR